MTVVRLCCTASLWLNTDQTSHETVGPALRPGTRLLLLGFDADNCHAKVLTGDGRVGYVLKEDLQW